MSMVLKRKSLRSTTELSEESTPSKKPGRLSFADCLKSISSDLSRGEFAMETSNENELPKDSSSEALLEKVVDIPTDVQKEENAKLPGTVDVECTSPDEENAQEKRSLPIESKSWIPPFSITYENPWGEWRPFSQKLVPLAKWKLCEASPRTPSQEEAEKHLPVKELEEIKGSLKEPLELNQVRVTWLGHASVLLQFKCGNVLCDPVFSDRIGPIKYVASYYRYRAAPISVKDLPSIDAVVISHNHYDHLDLESVRDLHGRFKDKLQWLVPMGLKQWMCSNGISTENVSELMWWEEKNLKMSSEDMSSSEDVTFTLTPTQHWCLRTGFDKNQALWGSWAVCTEKVKTWFGGDTGYCKVFKEIGKTLGPFHFAAIPIGAFKPRDVMRDQHVAPEDSVEIHKDIKSKQSLGIHWGTFTMGAIEGFMEPKEELKLYAEKAGLCPDNDFFVVDHGESRVITADDLSEAHGVKDECVIHTSEGPETNEIS